eukprot:COSAG04_NODE_968_length_9110_cov_6.799911_4_plen_144_part_00
MQSSVDCVPYLPGTQGVHVEAPEACRVSVIDPGGQSTQSSVEFPLNLPAVHARHDEAPTASNVLVTSPGSHVVQSETWSLPYDATYRLAGQPIHTTVEFVPYRPCAQRVHDTAPSSCKVSVNDPAWHTIQSTFESAEYIPAEH